MFNGQKLQCDVRRKIGNWQPSRILAASLIFYMIARHSNQNCFIDPYVQSGTENETFASS